MSKRLILSMFLVTLLCGPAVADSPAKPTIRIGLRIDAGKDTRHYDLILLEHQCGSIETKSLSTTSIDDEIKICAGGDGAKVALHLEWRTRDNDHEIHNTSSALVAHGSTFDLDGGTTKLVVSLQ